MTEDEKLDLILSKMDSMQEDIIFIKDEVNFLKEETASMKKDIISLNNEVASMKKDITSMKKDIISLNNEIASMKEDIAALKNNIITIEKNVEELNENYLLIKLKIENEINHNIQLIAEGHLDLARQLREITIPHNELEVFGVRLNIIDSDIREIKQKIS